MANGLFHFLNSYGSSDISTCVANIGEIAKTGTRVEHPADRVEDLAHLGGDLGLIEVVDHTYRLTDFGRQYVGLATEMWSINRGQGHLLGDSILQSPLKNRTIYALSSLLGLLWARRSATIPDLMDTYTTVLGKERTWRKPITRHDKTRYILTYWLELGYVRKDADVFSLTVEGEQGAQHLMSRFQSWPVAGSLGGPDQDSLSIREAAASSQATQRLANPEELDHLLFPSGQLSETLPPQPTARKLETYRHFAARRVDFGVADADARSLGEAGESLVVSWERAELRRCGREDLAELVEHTSKSVGDGAGYDVRSFTYDGAPKYIEVKTTTGGPGVPFHVSPNELAFSQLHPGSYYIYRLYEFDRHRLSAKFYWLKGSISANFQLEPSEYLARR